MGVSGRRNVAKAAAVTAVTASFSVLAAAQYGGGGRFAQMLNTYFLPQGAQVTGLSGLIFSVFIPFAIVAILLVAGLQTIEVFNRRQASLLGVLIALFIVPSGGYKIISETLLALFGLGQTGVSAPGLTGTPLDPLLESPLWMGILAYFLSVYALNNFVTGAETGFTLREHLAGGTVAVLVYVGLSGSQTFLILAVFWGLILIFGWKMFKRGTGMGGGTGFLIAIFGIFLLGIGVTRMEILPEEIQAMGSTVTGYISGAFWVLLILAVVAGAVALGVKAYQEGLLQKLIS